MARRSFYAGADAYTVLKSMGTQSLTAFLCWSRWHVLLRGKAASIISKVCITKSQIALMTFVPNCVRLAVRLLHCKIVCLCMGSHKVLMGVLLLIVIMIIAY